MQGYLIALSLTTRKIQKTVFGENVIEMENGVTTKEHTETLSEKSNYNGEVRGVLVTATAVVMAQTLL